MLQASTAQTLRKPCVVANWKMQGSKEKNRVLMKELMALAAEMKNLNAIDIFICPPTIYLEQISHLITNPIFQLGAQNVYFEKNGAYTGETSVSMLVDLGCKTVIIGHSERRCLLAETNELIARKFQAAYHGGLIPILCVGETEEEREQGKTFDIIRKQMHEILVLAGISAFNKAMIAYEPIWAIGSGKAAKPEDAQEVQGFIRSLLAEHDPKTAEKTRILYGGSVKGNNAAAIFAKADIDGGLIGGASLNAQEFLAICHAAIPKAF